MKTSPKQISLFTEEQLTSLPEDSPVNHTQWQASDLERKMSDTSGQRCLERFGKFSRHGLWAKTFSALLIGQEGWYSTKCRLIWKLKGTKYNRMYFQLAPSTHHIVGTESGLLLKTPTKMDGEVSSGKKNPVTGNSGTLAQEIMSGYEPTMQKLGLLPTPTAMDSTGATATMKSTQVKEGSMHSVTLNRAMAMGMLPTPQQRDWNTPEKPENWEKRRQFHAEKGVNLQLPLNTLAGMGMLPTPTCQDANKASKKMREDHQNNLTAIVFNQLLPTPTSMLITPSASDGLRSGMTMDSLKSHNKPNAENSNLAEQIAHKVGGGTSHLSPQFVLEMMGFPTDWTLQPFLSQSGETNQSKPEAMQ
jgi:hypothetical protein